MTFAELDDSNRAELWAVLALNSLRGLGAHKQKCLVDHFGTAFNAVQSAKVWSEIGLEISPRIADSLMRGHWRLKAKEKWDLIKKSNVQMFFYSSEVYPVLLKETPDPPLLLFYIGDLTLLSSNVFAVVGSRSCSQQGVFITAKIVTELSSAGITCVSGMALGIDRVAHVAGMEGIGKSIAVLGSGVDVPYPSSNKDVYSLLVKEGLILSEFLPGVKAHAGNFPIRNRIISGLAKGVLVVEATLRSGSLITARHALEQDRDVFAVPGNILSDESSGCHDLIRRGAHACFSAEDILVELLPLFSSDYDKRDKLKAVTEKVTSLDELNKDNLLNNEQGELTEPFFSNVCRSFKLPLIVKKPAFAQKNCAHKVLHIDKSGGRDIVASPLEPCLQLLEDVKAMLGPDDRLIIDYLKQHGATHIDELAENIFRPTALVSSALVMLEVKSIVSKLPGMTFSLHSKYQ